MTRTEELCEELSRLDSESARIMLAIVRSREDDEDEESEEDEEEES